MFYYVSFLRPPPLQVLPSSLVIIVPQIANDLRTELYEGSQDIFYSWSLATSGNSINATKSARLTTWRQTNAYKEIAVPLPPGVRDGQSWRLSLSPEPLHTPIDFKFGSRLGELPFPVMSMPITFTKNAGNESKKQESIERHYRLTFARDVQRSSEADHTLKIIEQTSFDLDKKIWDSGIGLSSWIVSLANNTEPGTHENRTLIAQLRDALFNPTSTGKIIELGAGTGIVSLTLGVLRSVLATDEGEGEEEGDGCLLTTDLPSAMPLLEHNISLNSHLFARPADLPKAEVLDWDAELPSSTHALRGTLNAIVMADVTYNTASFPALIRTLSNLINLNPVDKPPLILLAYKERDVTERSLWMMAEEINIHFENVGERLGAGGAPVEVWIGQVKA
ncbi:putative methyltransferase-domain-containing protein [Lentinula raphanica]|nr:putative methyltransferase-domain-containing protein [Lentinula raphanica]